MRLKEIKPGMVIHCKTEEEVILLCEWVKKRNGLSITKDFESEMLDAFRNDYYFGIRENCLEITVNWGGRAVEFSDLIIPELSAAEVPAILYEICKEYSKGGVNCNPDCPFAFHGMKCDQYKAENGQRVAEICEQWKANHKEKEPEFEWVDVCRIIEVQGNGKKVCVHEEDLSDHWKELTVEVVLKNYIATHEGNYIAVIEHVCRAKQ